MRIFSLVWGCVRGKGGVKSFLDEWKFELSLSGSKLVEKGGREGG